MEKYNFTKPIEIKKNSNESQYILLPINESFFQKLLKSEELTSNLMSKDDVKTIIEISKNRNFEAKCGENLFILGLGKEKKLGVILHGLGETKINEENKHEKLANYENKGGSICDFLRANKITNIEIDCICIDGVSESLQAEIAISISSGIVQKIYAFTKHLTVKEKLEKIAKIESISIKTNEKIEEKLNYTNAVLESIYIARDLGNEPANILHPEAYAKIIVDEMKQFKNIEIEVLDKGQMQKLGMGSLLGVALGSDTEPKTVIVKYTGNKNSDKTDIALVGKGLTFDNGGISIKPSNGMEDMKDDMAGSALCFAEIRLLAKREAKINAICAVGIVENSINGSAQRPGDIVKSMSGQTIEVLNTDAEGRLVLADVLYYTKTKHNPETIVDFATLTGAIRVALGSEYAGLFSNNDDLAKEIAKAGDETCEKCWRLPMGDKYDRLLDSPIADIKNISGTGGAGSITAAQFLQRFIDKHERWAHIDIAATGCIFHSPITLSQNGASGFGIKMVERLIKNTIEK